MTLYNTFIADVQKHGKSRHNRYVRLAVKRHVDDLKSSKKKSYRYKFDPAKADKVIKFVMLLRHTKGQFANKRFKLQPFQAFIIACIFGWVRKDNGLRRFSKAYIEIARKNGKTELAAAIGLYMQIADGEQGAEVYSAATKKDQARICFNAAKSMAKKLRQESPKMHALIGVGVGALTVLSTESIFKPLAADSDTEDGTNPHLGIIDEYHAHPTDAMLKVLETGQGARQQPLILVITTAGFNQDGACYRFRGVCVHYLEGVLVNDNTFAIIFTLDDEDDVYDPTKWIKSNPNLGNAPYLRYMHTQANNARTEGASAEVEFKTKNNNIWTQTAETWITADVLHACRSKTPEIKAGTSVLAGLDLSQTNDITTFTIYDPEDRVFQTWGFCPSEKLTDRKNIDKASYLQFQKDGHLIITDGNVIDYDYVTKKICEIADKYYIRAIGYDPFNSSQLVINLTNQNIECVKFNQGFPSMSPPTKELEKMIYGGEVSYIENAMIEWMFSNVAIKFNSEGQIKPFKGRGKDRNKIDGVISMIIAYGLSMSDEYNDSVYNDRGLQVLTLDDTD